MNDSKYLKRKLYKFILVKFLNKIKVMRERERECVCRMIDGDMI